MKNTKYCNKCKNILDVSKFTQSKSRYDGLQSYCQDCMKKYRKEHYYNNKKEYMNRSRSSVKRLRMFIERYKRIFGKCHICGESRPWVLDFHHKDPLEKDLEVSKIANFGSVRRVKDEIRKCSILCANCHRDLHYKLKNGAVV